MAETPDREIVFRRDVNQNNEFGKGPKYKKCWLGTL